MNSMTNEEQNELSKASKSGLASIPPAAAKITAESLVPDWGDHALAGLAQTFTYWVGVIPSCPVESIDLAGIAFPKMNELLVPDPLRTNVKRRVPVIGSIVRLTYEHIQRMRERLPRTIVRLYDGGQEQEPGTGQNVGDNHVRPKRGQLITIPSPELVEARRSRGKPIRLYSRQPNDVPAANYMFAILCKDQERGERSEHYPDTLNVTGIDWPGNLEGQP